MESKNIRLNVNGISRNQVDADSQPGDCQELIGMRFKDNNWQSVGDKVSEYGPITAGIDYTKIYKHPVLEDNQFIGLGDDNKIYYFSISGATISETEILDLDTETFLNFSHMGLILIVASTTNKYYLKYNADADSYSELETPVIPLLSFTSGSEQTANSEAGSDFEEAKTNYQALVSTYKDSGYFEGCLLIRVAFRMFDNNYYFYSQIFIANIGDISDLQYNSSTYIFSDFKPGKLFGQYQISASDASNLEKWRGIIQSLVIFVTPSSSRLNVNSSLSEYTNEGGGIYSPSPANIENIFQDNGYFYFAHEIPLVEITDTPDPGVTFAININQNAIATKEALPINNFTNHNYIARDNFEFNSRLHLGDVITILTNGYSLYHWDGLSSPDTTYTYYLEVSLKEDRTKYIYKQLSAIFANTEETGYYQWGIARDANYAYGVDRNNHKIVKFSLNLTYLSEIGSLGTGNDNFNYPYGMDSDGTHIYIADNRNDRIVKRLASNLSYVDEVSSDAVNYELNNPLDVYCDGTYLYILCYEALGAGYGIVKLQTDFTYVTKIVGTGSGNDQFNQPYGIDGDGTNLYIADTQNNRIHKRLCSDLSYVAKIGSFGTGNDNFDGPYGITVYGSFVYVVDTGNNRLVKRATSDLSYSDEIGEYGVGNDQFNNPTSIDNDGTYLYLQDTYNSRIERRLISDLSYYDRDKSLYLYFAPCICYPDRRAFRIRLLVYDSGNSVYRLLQTWDLTSHSILNIAYYANFNNNGQPVNNTVDQPDMTETEYTLQTEDNLIEDENRVQVSELDNPFYYPTVYSYRVGDSETEILKLITPATEPLSEGQYGEFPVIIFTTKGIWALQQGSGSILYANATPININEICNNADSILNINGLLTYATNEGFKLLRGRDPVEISQPIEADIDNKVYSHSYYVKYLSDSNYINIYNFISTINFLDFIANCRVGYDHIEKEIILSYNNDDTSTSPISYSYVYSLISQKWTKRAETYSQFINVFPKFYGLKDDALYDLSDEDKSAYAKILIQTRPINFGTGNPKKILTSIFRGHFEIKSRTYAGIYIYGSNDRDNYFLLSISEIRPDIFYDLKLGRLPMSAKNFIIVLAGQFTDSQLAYLEMTVAERFQNKLR